MEQRKATAPQGWFLKPPREPHEASSRAQASPAHPFLRQPLDEVAGLERARGVGVELDDLTTPRPAQKSHADTWGPLGDGRCDLLPWPPWTARRGSTGLHRLPGYQATPARCGEGR